jgi:hypothetical protein
VHGQPDLRLHTTIVRFVQRRLGISYRAVVVGRSWCFVDVVDVCSLKDQGDICCLGSDRDRGRTEWGDDEWSRMPWCPWKKTVHADAGVAEAVVSADGSMPKLNDNPLQLQQSPQTKKSQSDVVGASAR